MCKGSRGRGVGTGEVSGVAHPRPYHHSRQTPLCHVDTRQTAAGELARSGGSPPEHRQGSPTAGSGLLSRADSKPIRGTTITTTNTRMHSPRSRASNLCTQARDE